MQTQKDSTTRLIDAISKAKEELKRELEVIKKTLNEIEKKIK